MGTEQTNEKTVSRTRGRRRQYVINPAFQWKYTVSVVVGVFLVSSLLSIVLFGVLHQQARARLVNPAASYPWENALTIVFSAAAFATLLSVALGLWSILVTHRISGPIFVMQRYLTELAAGRFPTARPLRKKDEFKEFFGELWRTIDALKAAKQADLAALTEVLNMARSAADADGEDRRRTIEALTARLETLREEAADTLGEELDTPPAAPPKDRGSVSKPTGAYAGLPG